MPKRIFWRGTFKEKKGAKGWIRLILRFLGLTFLSLVFVFLFVFVFYTKDFPRPERFAERIFTQSTKIYDRSGQVLLYEIYGEEKREIVNLNQIPEILKKAVIAAEDRQFYSHHGIEIKSIFRAILTNLKIRKTLYGGSTISQQLIRSSFLTREKSLERKIKELVLTLELERRYSKDQILEFYLNQVPFGSNSYGVAAASKTFFNKPIHIQSKQVCDALCLFVIDRKQFIAVIVHGV